MENSRHISSLLCIKTHPKVAMILWVSVLVHSSGWAQLEGSVDLGRVQLISAGPGHASVASWLVCVSLSCGGCTRAISQQASPGSFVRWRPQQGCRMQVGTCKAFGGFGLSVPSAVCRSQQDARPAQLQGLGRRSLRLGRGATKSSGFSFSVCHGPWLT